jgi:hypothetical protein
MRDTGPVFGKPDGGNLWSRLLFGIVLESEKLLEILFVSMENRFAP